MSFNRTPFKSINAYSFSPASTAGVVGITTVDPNYSMIIFNGCASFDTGGFSDGNGSTILYALAASQVSYSCFTTGSLVKFTVIEFYQYQLRQAVQYAYGTMNGVTSTNVTITAVGPKAFVNYLGYAENITSAQADMGSVTACCALTSTTNVQLVRFGTGGISAPDQSTLAFCVVDPW